MCRTSTRRRIVQQIRDLVFDEIARMKNVQVHRSGGRLSSSGASRPHGVYAQFGSAFSEPPFAGIQARQYGQVGIIFDKCLTKKQQGAFEAAVAPVLKRARNVELVLPGVAADFNGQIADYAAWAKFVALERDEARPSTASAAETDRPAAVPLTEVDLPTHPLVEEPRGLIAGR